MDIDNNLGVLDIETYLDDNNHSIPFSLGIKTHNMSQSISYYLGDFNSHEDMMIKFFSDLMIKENHKLSLYAHNMGKFDGIILLKYLFLCKDKLDLKFKILAI